MLVEATPSIPVLIHGKDEIKKVCKLQSHINRVVSDAGKDIDIYNYTTRLG